MIKLYHGSAVDLNVGDLLCPDMQWAVETGCKGQARLYFTRYKNFAAAFALRNLSRGRPDVLSFKVGVGEYGSDDYGKLRDSSKIVMAAMRSASDNAALSDILSGLDISGWIPWGHPKSRAFLYTVQPDGPKFNSRGMPAGQGFRAAEYYTLDAARITAKQIVTPEYFLESGRNELVITHYVQDIDVPGKIDIEHMHMHTAQQLRQHMQNAK